MSPISSIVRSSNCSDVSNVLTNKDYWKNCGFSIFGFGVARRVILNYCTRFVSLFILNLIRLRGKRKIEMHANEIQIKPMLEYFLFLFQLHSINVDDGHAISCIYLNWDRWKCQLNIKIICTFDMNNGTCCLVAIHKVNWEFR